MPRSLLLDAAVDLFLGGACAGCERPGRLLCRCCRDFLQAAPVLPVSRGALPGFPPVFGRGDYAGVLRSLIIGCKERGGLALVGPLGDALVAGLAASCLTAGPGEGWVVVPVPSAPGRIRERGFDLTGLLARRAVRRIRSAGVPLRLEPLLRQRPGVLDQAGLGARERRANLDRALEVCLQRSPAPVLLVDDIVTTGSTLAAAGTVLAQAGHRVLGAAVLADTRKRR